MRRPALLLLIALSVFTSCKNNDPNQPEPPAPAPGKAVLNLPSENSLCVTGSVISEAQSTVDFSWTATSNTDGYQLEVKNLLTGTVTNKLTTSAQAQVTLLRNTPYSWSVTSLSSNTIVTTQSNTWRFYNAGSGITSYAPFSPLVTAPAYGRAFATGTTKVDLSWTCSDVDNDITGYDVYLGTTATPTLLQANVTTQFLKDVPVSAVSTYYFYVIAKDSKGNTSRSDTFVFTVK